MALGESPSSWHGCSACLRMRRSVDSPADSIFITARRRRSYTETLSGSRSEIPRPNRVISDLTIHSRRQVQCINRVHRNTDLVVNREIISFRTKPVFFTVPTVAAGELQAIAPRRNGCLGRLPRSDEKPADKMRVIPFLNLYHHVPLAGPWDDANLAGRPRASEAKDTVSVVGKRLLRRTVPDGTSWLRVARFPWR